jgi:ribosomal silencing factor RsfS
MEGRESERGNELVDSNEEGFISKRWVLVDDVDVILGKFME